MASKVIKGDILMEIGNSGWSESWYFQGEDYTPAGVKAGLLNTLGQARAQGLGKFARVAYLRTSDVAVARDSDVGVRNYTSTPFSGTNPDHRADNPSNCWLMRTEANAGARRSFHTNGGPDFWFSRDAAGTPNVDASLEGFRQYYQAALISVGARLQVLDQDKGNNPFLSAVNVINVGGFCAIRLRNIGTITVGDFIQTYGFRNYRPSFSGRFLVTALTGEFGRDVVINRPYNFTAEGDHTRAGVRLVLFNYQPVTALVLLRPAVKKVGRPFFQPVGRRRKAQK